jgi:hypothetical protein
VRPKQRPQREDVNDAEPEADATGAAKDYAVIH